MFVGGNTILEDMIILLVYDFGNNKMFVTVFVIFCG